MSEHQRRYGGLFWRLSASYFVATLAAAFIGTYVGRFNGPFGDFRDNPLVRWFNHRERRRPGAPATSPPRRATRRATSSASWHAT